jgi:cytosine/adenosine deaminase-related metal-dependent hydrolase
MWPGYCNFRPEPTKPQPTLSPPSPRKTLQRWRRLHHAATSRSLGPLTVARAVALLYLDDRGTRASGKLADFVVVEGKPDLAIADIDRVVAVWHRGKRVAKRVSDFTP